MGLALGFTQLFQKHDECVNTKMAIKNAEIERFTNEMDEIQELLGLEDFLEVMHEKTKDSRRLKFDTKEDQDRIDRLREFESLRSLFPEGKYEWKENEIDELARKLKQRIEALPNQINMKMQELHLDREDLLTINNISRLGLDRLTSLIDQILRNTIRG